MKKAGISVGGQVKAGQWKSRSRSGVVDGNRLGGPPLLLRKEQRVYDAENYAIYRALRAIDQRGEDGHQYTIFSGSASAVDRVRSDRMSPG